MKNSYVFIWRCRLICSIFAIDINYSFIKHKTMNTITNGTQVPQETKETKVLFSVNHLIREGETAKQLQKRLAAEKRAATNEAGKNLVKAIKGEFLSLSLIREIFKNDLLESSEFCAALSVEIGKTVTVQDVYKLPMREYLDYVNETEAARGMIRGGITPTEFKNIILRYYRGIKPKNAQLVDADIKDVLNTVYRNN